MARRLLGLLMAAQASGRVPSVALTGGTIADQVHRELARISASTAVDWSHVDLWWGDERFLERGSDDRNERQAREAWLDSLMLDPARVHAMPADTGQSVTQAAETYAREVREHGSGGFDVVMLGVGPDGHVASLFPGHPALDAPDQIAVGLTDSPKPPPERVTLTLEALNRTRAAWFLVSGEEKAEAVARALGGADVHDVPAAGVRGTEETLWFLDESAASRL